MAALATAACGGGAGTDDLGVDAEPTGLRVDTGADLTIMTPIDSVTLRATVAGADGAPTTLAWTQLAGAAATLTGQGTDTLTASDLAIGSYAFRIEVTTTGASASAGLVCAPSGGGCIEPDQRCDDGPGELTRIAAP